MSKQTTDSHVRYPRAAALPVVRCRPVAGHSIFVPQFVHVAVDFAELSPLVRAAGNQHAVLAAALDSTPPVLDIHHSFSAVLRAVARATLDVSKVGVLPATFGGAGLENELEPVGVGCRQARVARTGGRRAWKTSSVVARCFHRSPFARLPGATRDVRAPPDSLLRRAPCNQTVSLVQI